MKIGNSFNTQTSNYIQQNKTSAEQSLSKISAEKELSGKDGANYLNANALSTQISTLTQNVQNENESIAMSQIADSAIRGVYDGAQKLNELSISFDNGALSSTQKDALQTEFKATVDSMNATIGQANYNGKPLLTSESNLEVQSMDSLSIDDQESISTVMQNLDALNSEVGATMNNSAVGIANSLSAMSNLTSSYAQTSETPMDQKINDFSKSQIKLESSLIAQVHQTTMLQQRMSVLLA